MCERCSGMAFGWDPLEDTNIPVFEDHELLKHLFRQAYSVDSKTAKHWMEFITADAREVIDH